MNNQSLSIPEHINALLLLDDGKIFYGKGAGFKGDAIGEICFNTSLTGYQETLSDPSYAGQIINFTFPHIGNVGFNKFDDESFTHSANGMITREDITCDSNYRSEGNLNDWLIKNKITAISGLDTRAITRHIRKNGTQNAIISYADNFNQIDIQSLKDKLKSQPALSDKDLAKDVSCIESFQWSEGCWNDDKYNQPDANYNVVVIDYGVKLNILRCLSQVGCKLHIVPAKSSIEDILKLNPDGVFLSNGPGDPAQTAKYAVPVIKDLLDKQVPIFGICLGHQLLSIALGCKTQKLHQGHRGANHPVKNIDSNLVEITSQNHGFVVTKESVGNDIKISHLSLFDNTIEGLECFSKKAFSVQHHPEASPGPTDSFYLFEKFISLMKK